MPDDELLILADASAIAGVSTSQLRTLAGAGRIPGAVLRENEGMRGRWYVPREWAEAKAKGEADPPTKRQQVEDLARAEPDLSRAEIARRVGCSRGYVSRLLGPLEGAESDASADARPRPTPNAERREAPAGETRPAPFSMPDLGEVSIYQSLTMQGEYYIVWREKYHRVPDVDGGWKYRTVRPALPAKRRHLKQPEAARVWQRLRPRDEERARRRLAGGDA